MSTKHSPKTDDLSYYLKLAKKFKDENLTIPGKAETIKSIKHALNHCTKDQLYLIADMLDLPHKTSETRMKLNILDKTQQIIYGHVIQGWNSVARWGFVLVLYYLLAQIGITSMLDKNNIFILILGLLGSYQAIRFLVKFKKSWDMRRLIQMKMMELKLVKSTQPSLRKKSPQKKSSNRKSK